MAETDAVVAAGLSKRYRRHWALRDVNLTIPAGRVTALVGPNGAGKTTLLHLMVGLLRPSAGRLRVLGQEPGPASLPRIGFVAQDKPLLRDFRVRDLVRLGGHLNPTWDHRYANDRLAAYGIDTDRPAGRLSGGQQAQVALTLALAKRPRLLLLDEPAANLDPVARRQFLAAVAAESAATGVSVVHSSHDLAGLDRGCDHLVVLRDSTVVIAGDLADVVPEGVGLDDFIYRVLTEPMEVAA